MNIFQIPLDALKELFERFSFRGLLYVVAQVIVIALVAYLIERMGGFLFYRSLEKQVALLKELQTLSDNGTNQNPELDLNLSRDS
jgi:hypothetical protein